MSICRKSTGLCLGLLILLSGCGGGGGDSKSSGNPGSTVSSYTIGGTVSGLAAGQQVTLLNNGGNATTVTANGNFVFTMPIVHGASFVVTVGTQPIVQTCAITNGIGANITSNISNVSVNCQISIPVVKAGSLYIGSPGKPMALVDPLSGALTVQSPLSCTINSAAVGPDGKAMGISSNGNVYRFNPSGDGVCEALFTLGPGYFRDFAVAPDGTIATIFGSMPNVNNGNLNLYDSTGKVKGSIPVQESVPGLGTALFATMGLSFGPDGNLYTYGWLKGFSTFNLTTATVSMVPMNTYNFTSSIFCIDSSGVAYFFDGSAKISRYSLKDRQFIGQTSLQGWTSSASDFLICR